MSQQINFYNTKLVKPKDWFSLTTVGIIYVLAAGLMMFFYQQLQAETAASEQSRQQAQLAFDKTQQRLAEAMANTQNVSKLQAQETMLKTLQEKYAMQEKIMHVFEQTQTGVKQHVADYMLALSRQTVEKVWLTGFKLNPFKDSVSLFGRAYKSDLVPQYIQSLSTDPIFKGQLFGGIKLKEIEQANEHGASAQSTSAKPEPIPPTVQGATATSMTNPQAQAKAEPQSLTLIEFEVNGLEGKPKGGHESNSEEAKTKGDGDV